MHSTIQEITIQILPSPGTSKIWTTQVSSYTNKKLGLNQPLPKVKKAKAGGASAEPEIPQDLVDNLVAMLGFPEKKVKKALKNTVSDRKKLINYRITTLRELQTGFSATWTTPNQTMK